MKINIVVLVLVILIYSCNNDKYPNYFTYNEIKRTIESPWFLPDTVAIGNNTNCYLVIQNDKGEGEIVFDSLGTHNIIGKYYNTNNSQLKKIRVLQYFMLQDTSYFVDKFVRISIMEYKGRKIQCYEKQYKSDVDTLVNIFEKKKQKKKSKINQNKIDTNDASKFTETHICKILDPEWEKNKKRRDSINKIRRDSLLAARQHSRSR